MKLCYELEFSHVDKKKGLVIPKYMINELAEFMGILVGDGYIGKYKNDKGIKRKQRIEIVGHSEHEREYLNGHVKYLLKELFNLEVKIVKRYD